MKEESEMKEEKPMHTLSMLPDQIRKTIEIANALQEKISILNAVIVGPKVIVTESDTEKGKPNNDGSVADSYRILDILSGQLCELDKQLSEIISYCK